MIQFLHFVFRGWPAVTSSVAGIVDSIPPMSAGAAGIFTAALGRPSLCFTSGTITSWCAVMSYW